MREGLEKQVIELKENLATATAKPKKKQQVRAISRGAIPPPTTSLSPAQEARQPTPTSEDV